MTPVTGELKFRTHIQCDGKSVDATAAAVEEAWVEARAAGVPDAVRLISVHTMDNGVYLTIWWEPDPAEEIDDE